MSISYESAHLKALLPKVRLFLFFIAAIYSAGFSVGSTADESAQSLYQQAVTSLSRGDSTSALNFLNKTLELDPKHGEAYLARGRLFLAAGNLDAARVDFNYASFSKHAEIKARAFIGLGDIYRRTPYHNWQAIGKYRIALKIASEKSSVITCEAYYAIAETAFDLGWTDGFETADNALVNLICLDPKYKDAIYLWWEKIYIQSDKDLRRVANSLENHLVDHLDSCSPLLYLAKIRNRLGEYDSTLCLLEKLETICPEYKRSESFLLEANSYLGLGDTLEFENSYMQAIDYAKKEEDFTMLFREAEPIFNPSESKKWEDCETPEEKANFFYVFWKRRDPDPISNHNERLINHYERLHKAKKMFYEFTPHSFYNTSPTYYRLEAPRPSYNFDNPYFDSEYDPEIWWDNCRSLALQHRGLFFIRHGEPDMLYRFGLPWEASMTTPSYEAWRYGTSYFLFDRNKGFYAVKSYAEQGNITRAMESETFKDPVPALRQASYGVAFKGPGDMLEMEFYQSIPVSVDSISFETPEAMVVVYDSVWHELVHQRQKSHRVFTGRDSMCIAVTSVNIQPGPIIYALRLDVPGYRSVVRQTIEPPPYSRNRLELSGIVIGTPPGAGAEVHSRYDVPLFPRPSMNFRLDEAIHVYFEIYGLGSTEDGRCRYRLDVTTSLLEAHEGPLEKIFGTFSWWNDKRRTSLTLGFDRSTDHPEGHTLPENFSIDTSFLVPGAYLLTVMVQDELTSQKARSICRFEIVSE